jgi:hypothetical protein
MAKITFDAFGLKHFMIRGTRFDIFVTKTSYMMPDNNNDDDDVSSFLKENQKLKISISNDYIPSTFSFVLGIHDEIQNKKYTIMINTKEYHDFERKEILIPYHFLQKISIQIEFTSQWIVRHIWKLWTKNENSYFYWIPEEVIKDIEVFLFQDNYIMRNNDGIHLQRNGCSCHECFWETRKRKQ